MRRKSKWIQSKYKVILNICRNHNHIIFYYRHKNCVEQITKLSKNIKKPFAGTLMELEAEILSFNQRMSDLKFECCDVEVQLTQMKKSSEEFQKTLAMQDKKRCIAQQELKSQQECKLQLTTCIKDLCEKLQIPLETDALENPDKLSELVNEIDEMIMLKQTEITELMAHNDQADQSRQAKIDELRTEITKSEQSITTQEKQKTASERRSEALELEIKQIETSLHQLKVLEKQIADTDEKYERAKSSCNQEACRQIIETKKASIAEKQARFKKLDEKLTFLSSIAKLMTEISLKEKELEKKNQEIHRVKSKHSDKFVKFFPEPISSNYRRSMQNAYDKLRREVQDLNEQSNSLKLKEQSHEIKRKNLISDISRMEKELQKLEESIYQKCHSTPYDELILRSKSAISKLQLEHGALKSAEAMYKK